MIFHKREELGSPFAHIFVVADMGEHGLLSSKSTNYVAPLYVYDNNTSIAACRQQKTNGFNHIFATDSIIESSFVSNKTAEITSQFPLYVQPDKEGRRANFDVAILQELFSDIEEPTKDAKTVYPEDILDYVYGILHDLKYRAKYKDFLKMDFPRIPRPKTWKEFWLFALFGRQLRELHLMQGVSAGDYPLQGDGDSVVTQCKYIDRNVFINDSQYFAGVPLEAWEFWIGGYQPAQKWLKDRKGRPLGYKEVEHYQKIITILHQTHTLMQTLDQ